MSAGFLPAIAALLDVHIVVDDAAMLYTQQVNKDGCAVQYRNFCVQGWPVS
jgi:hypothetical protein